MKGIRVALLGVMMTVIFCACEKPVQFTEQTSVTEQEVSVEEATEEVAETEVETLSELLSEDARKIVDFTGVEPGEYEDIRDLNYYTEYVDSMYDIPYWKASGTAAMICGYEPAKTQEQVVAYLNSRAPKGFVLLFEAFFNKKYATDEIVEYAQSYAYYLTKATLEKHSFAEFMTEDYRGEWFKSVGCTREYEYDEYDRLIENGKSYRKEGITEFKVGKHMWVYGGENWVRSAQELYDVIHDGYKGFDYMEELVKADAPAFFETYAKDRYAVVELADKEWSYTKVTDYGGWITLAWALHAPHEYMHALTLRAGGPDVMWMGEGVAESYSFMNLKGEGYLNAFDYIEFMKGNVSEDFWKDSELSDRQRVEPLLVECREAFNSYKEMFGDDYTENLYTYLAMGEKEIETKESLFGFGVTDAYEITRIPGGGKDTVADELSYPGATVLVKEMIKDFGADKVLTYLYVGGDFEKAFGMTSAEYLEKVRVRGSYKLNFFYNTPYTND
ncbi:MAG: hypothetical protein J5811_03965 [Lachnospiraceae bacterium]|nr:hypothetical protein [Lachnospiraceae bacterium]